MSKKPTDTDLKTALGSYKIPNHRENLSSIIAMKAAAIPQKKPIWSQIQTVFEDLLIPSPVYSMALAVVFSFFLGVADFGTVGNDLFLDESYAYSVDYILEEEVFL